MNSGQNRGWFGLSDCSSGDYGWDSGELLWPKRVTLTSSYACFKATVWSADYLWKMKFYLCSATRTRAIAFEMDGNTLRNTATGRVYPIRDGIPLFVSTVTGSNLKYQTLYDRIAPGYDLAERLYHWFTRKPDYRLEFISELEIEAECAGA